MDVCKTNKDAPDASSFLKRKVTGKPLVYVASAFSGDVERNIKKAQLYCRFAAVVGAIPLAPHLLLPQFISEATERDAAMQMNRVFLSRCDELWMFGDEITDGMAMEWVWAKQLDKPIRRFTRDCREISNETD